MAKPDPNIAAHLEWLGFVRPTGLVVSAPALVRAGAILDRRDAEGQRLLRECAEERSFHPEEEPQPWLPDFRAFAASVLGWNFSPKGYAGTDEAPTPPELEASLPDSGEVLRPDFAVRAEPVRSVPASSPAPASGASASPESGPPLPGVRESTAAYRASAPDKPGVPGTPGGWQLLVQVCGPGEDFDRAARVGGRWGNGSGSLEISPHGRMERLLRHTGVPAGLLFNGLSLRLVSAPRGESSGWLDFRVPDMCQSAGRPISTAMRLLLRETRLLAVPCPQRLAGLLADSRKFQNEVSERLAEQVLHALYELLRGFQAAHDASKGALLDEPLAANPDNIYRGLLTLVLRLVFLLYAEERDMLPQDDTFLGAYSLAGLHERLREDAALHPDTMDQRYGAYAQLLVLFRMVHDGARAGGMALPPRHGALFDPDRYRFLEGRTEGGARQTHERIEPPLVPDGTIYRVLQKLIVLDGERISYRALDVEHIGSVYETMMGFRLETAAGRSAAIRAAKKHGAPATVDVEALLREAPARRAKWIQDRTDHKLTDRVKQAVRESGSVEALHAALDPVIDRHATPDLVPAGAMVLQPSEERRRSGSHYTPRELTGPIVRTTLEPVEPMEPEPPPVPVGGESAEPVVRTTLEPVEPMEPEPSPGPVGGESAEPVVGTTLEPVEPLEPEPPPGPVGGESAEPVVGTTLEPAEPLEPEPPPGPVGEKSAEPIVRTTLRPVLGRLRGGRSKPPRPERILDLKVCDPAMGSGAFLVQTCRQLADALVESWRAHDAVPEIPPDEDEVIFARRLVAQRCLYGVDRNPVAVNLAKLSLWLATLAKDHPLTFLDHALRHGDSLVGLTRTQIEAFHWEVGSFNREENAPRFQVDFEVMRVREHLKEIAALRRRIREADEEVSDRERRLWWSDARDALNEVRIFGDLVLAAFFEEAKPKQREALRKRFMGAIERGETPQYRSWLEELRDGESPLAPFHWEIEFPEVFERENPGFDAMVGNPPFAGKNTVAAANVSHYPDWLKQAHPESHGNADLVAHFFRRAFDLVRRDGAFGLIATNTIAQGDTRSTGLRWICEHGGEIYRARRRVKWPGLAAVVVSVLHVAKGRFPGGAQHLGDKAAPDHGFGTLSAGSFPGVKRLDGEAAETITAFLFHRGGHDDPARLAANAGKSFQGSIVLGMGFTFDDTDTKGVATPLAEMRRLIEANPRNRQAIFPYIGGEEVNTSPTHAHHRYVINFRDWPLRREDLGARWADADDDQRRAWRRMETVPLDYRGPVAADWPDLLAIVEERVKPERMAQKDRGAKNLWWRFIRTRPELHAAIANLERVLAISRIGNAFAFTFLPQGMVYNEKTVVFPFSKTGDLATLQSRIHEVWARFFSSTLKDDLQYTPSDCFETFPFPEGWETHPGLEAAGKAYYDFRTALMVRSGEGLTKTYNRFHDRDEDHPDIARLRTLHAAMDRAVLDAYGWHDIPTDCEFLLDYAIDEEESGRRKKPWRYRWPDAIRDEVLARLLELNAERAAEEARAGAAARTSATARAKPAPGRPRRQTAKAGRRHPMTAEPRSLWDSSDG